MIKLRTIDFKELRAKRVLLRVDLDIAFDDGELRKSSIRLKSAMNTVRELHEAGASVVVMAHRGRPKDIDKKLSLAPIAKHIIEQLGSDIASFAGAAEYETILAKTQSMAPGDVLILENTRFHPGERLENDMAELFADQLATLGDVFVNDSFATLHRNVPSTTGVAKRLDSYAGPSIVKELEALEEVRSPKKRPYVAIVGGKKIKSKVHALTRLLDLADEVFVGGAIATTFFAAKGIDVGESHIDEKEIPIAKKLLKSSKLRLPEEVVVVSSSGEHRSTGIEDIASDEAIVDIGKSYIDKIRASCGKAKLLLWNGPVGIIEKPESRLGSDAIAHVIAEVARGSAYGVVGGGNTVGLLEELKIGDFVDHISTGGGAMLEYVGGQTLPALDTLTEEYAGQD